MRREIQAPSLLWCSVLLLRTITTDAKTILTPHTKIGEESFDCSEPVGSGVLTGLVMVPRTTPVN